MNKKEEREQFWINVGPESGYLGTIAEETARKNDGGISPDGKRLGWENASDCSNPNNRTDCNCNTTCDCDTTCDCGTDCNCSNHTDCDCDQNGNCNRDCNSDRDKHDIATDYPYGDPCDDILAPNNLPLFQQSAPCPCTHPERQNTETGE